MTFAPYGIGAYRSFDLMISTAFSDLKVGGSRTLTLTVVDFQITFPALLVGGISSIPVIVRQGLHHPFKYISA